jgi:hypothetical protein
MPRTEDSSRVNYKAFAASSSAVVCGAVGAKGDVIQRIIITVTTSGANGTCSITDGGGSAIPLAAASTAIGVYSIELGAKSTSGAWKVTTGSACSALAIGQFT